MGFNQRLPGDERRRGRRGGIWGGGETLRCGAPRGNQILKNKQKNCQINFNFVFDLQKEFRKRILKFHF